MRVYRGGQFYRKRKMKYPEKKKREKKNEKKHKKNNVPLVVGKHYKTTLYRQSKMDANWYHWTG